MIVVDEIEVGERNGHVEACARITANTRRHRVWFRWKGQKCPTPADAYLSAVLHPAMHFGGKVIIKGSVSERFLNNINKIQAIYQGWNRHLSFVDVKVDDIRPCNSRLSSHQAYLDIGNKVQSGCLFSGGVDSLYTVLKHLKELDHLIFIHGFDINLDEQSLRTRVSEVLQDAASRLEKNLIEVETNIRKFSDQYMSWPSYYAAAIAATGIMLSGQLSRLYVPANHTFTDIARFDSLGISPGTHPELDPLFGTEYIDFEHDGCEAKRIEKVKKLVDNDVAMDTLRVCWENRHSAYNCGQCEKCLRTMVNLELVDALKRCKTFDRTLNLMEVAKIVPKGEIARAFILENIEEGVQLGADPELLAALRKSLTRRLDFHPLMLYSTVRRKAASIVRKFNTT